MFGLSSDFRGTSDRTVMRAAANCKQKSIELLCPLLLCNNREASARFFDSCDCWITASYRISVIGGWKSCGGNFINNRMTECREHERVFGFGLNLLKNWLDRDRDGSYVLYFCAHMNSLSIKMSVTRPGRRTGKLLLDILIAAIDCSQLWTRNFSDGWL